jgi:hypothetical protein
MESFMGEIGGFIIQSVNFTPCVNQEWMEVVRVQNCQERRGKILVKGMEPSNSLDKL